jgi:serine protease Do
MGTLAWLFCLREGFLPGPARRKNRAAEPGVFPKRDKRFGFVCPNEMTGAGPVIDPASPLNAKLGHLSQLPMNLFMKQTLTRSLRSLLIAPVFFASALWGQNKLPEINVDPAPIQRTPANSYADIVEKVAPSVVTISINEMRRMGERGNRGNPLLDDPFFRRFFGVPEDRPDRKEPGKDQPEARRRPTQVGLGSGVIISSDGYILTNNHVVDVGDEIVITLVDGKTEYKAKKIGGDPGSDIAVIKVEAQNLKPITFADSDKIKAGDISIAIGNPFALRQSVTMGVISATGRNQTGISEFGNFIQTDAAINPGNSGGALVDVQGRLIGVNSAIFSRTGGNMGIGFAVPSNQARTVMESLIKFGKVQRGFLGIQMQEVDERLAKSFNLPERRGILVSDVIAGGGAEKAGIKNGDVIVELEGKPFEDMTAFRNSVANMMPGTQVKVKILRNGEPKDITIVLAERPLNGLAGAPAPVEKPSEKAPDVLDGVTVTDVKPEYRERFGIPQGTEGALVTQVDPNSACADAELNTGDVIVEIDGRPVKNSEDAVKISEEVKTKRAVRLRVSTKGNTRFVVVEERKDN